MEILIDDFKNKINEFKVDDKKIYLNENEDNIQIDIYDKIPHLEFGKMYQKKEIEELIQTSKVKLSLKFCHQISEYPENINFYHIKYGWIINGFFHSNYEVSNKDGNPLFKKILEHNCYLIYPSKIFTSINYLWNLIHNGTINIEQAQLLMNEIGMWIDKTNNQTPKNIVSLTDGSNPFENHS